MRRTFRIALTSVMVVAILFVNIFSLNVYAAVSQNDDGGEFYYRTMSLAFQDINDGSIGSRALPAKGTSYANVKISVSENSYDIYMLKSYTENNVISVQAEKPVNVYFDYYVLRSNSIAFDIYFGKVSLYANGRGGIIVNGTSKARCAQLRSGSLTIKGGCYEARATAGAAACIQSAGKLVVQNAKLTAVYPNGQARCVTTSSGSATVSTTMYNCSLTAIARSGRAICFYNSIGCTAQLRNCVANAYSDYMHTGSTSYAYCSVGVDNYGIMTLNDCTVYGTHSGVQSSGNLTVNKGKYSGYGHGGFYITGSGNYARISNANVSCQPMPSGFTATINCNQTAMYVGGQGATNTRVYMDRCRLDSASHPIVMRGTDGETDNYLYISNSVLVNSKRIRIDSNHQVYIGAGNNFNESAADYPEKVIKTNYTYK